MKIDKDISRCIIKEKDTKTGKVAKGKRANARCKQDAAFVAKISPGSFVHLNNYDTLLVY